MNRYDKEERIIEDFQSIGSKHVALFPINLKNIVLYNSIHSEKKWKNWVDTSAKNEMPPDFYNEKLKFMMDVMRIDDHAYINKKGRVINRHNERESKIMEEIINKNELFRTIAEKGNLFITPDSGLRGYDDHNYDFYISNFKRVVEKHITKIEKYKKNHPGFKTIFFILDESSPYAKCFEKIKNIKAGECMRAQPHFWWFDSNMLDVVIKSDIDFVIWMAPYKHFKSRPKLNLPWIAIYDIKKLNYKKLIKYQHGDMQSLEV